MLGMGSPPAFSLLVIFLSSMAAMVSSSFALTGIAELPRKEAESMGVEVHARPNGDAGIKFTLKFKARGKLRSFARVELRMKQSKEHLVSAPLAVKRAEDGTLSTSFSVAEKYIEGAAFWIYVSEPPLGGTAYRLKVREFLH